MSNALFYQLQDASDKLCTKGFGYLGSIKQFEQQLIALRTRNSELESIQKNYDRAINSMPASYRAHFHHVLFGDQCDCQLPVHIIPYDQERKIVVNNP